MLINESVLEDHSSRKVADELPVGREHGRKIDIGSIRVLGDAHHVRPDDEIASAARQPEGVKARLIACSDS